MRSNVSTPIAATVYTAANVIVKDTGGENLAKLSDDDSWTLVKRNKNHNQYVSAKVSNPSAKCKPSSDTIKCQSNNGIVDPELNIIEEFEENKLTKSLPRVARKTSRIKNEVNS